MTQAVEWELNTIRETQRAMPEELRSDVDDAAKTACAAISLARSSSEHRRALLAKGAAWALYALELTNVNSEDH